MRYSCLFNARPNRRILLCSCANSERGIDRSGKEKGACEGPSETVVAFVL